MQRVVTLTTDFGTGSDYVAQMKGLLLHATAPFTLIDISHDIPAHDIRAAAWLVAQACPAFPADTLHLVVVDPGVGTPRRLVWARIGGQQFIAPDNGVLGWAMLSQPLADARQIAVPEAASATFHGRDVIAPAAVRLLDGACPESLGTVATDLHLLAWPELREQTRGLVGEVVHVDAFGNLVTNLSADVWPRVVRAGQLLVGQCKVTTMTTTYGTEPPGTVVALCGSHGFVEIAVVEGRAEKHLAANVGTPVAVTQRGRCTNPSVADERIEPGEL